MNLKTGVDLIEIERIQQVIARHPERFLERIYTLRERAEVGANTASLAARFAAKEAVAKALGTGIGPVGWHEIEVLRGPSQQPVLHLHGQAEQLARQQGLNRWSLSLSHTRKYAVAMVVGFSD